MELRELPAVHVLTRDVDDPLATDAARAVLARARADVLAGRDPGDLRSHLQEELGRARRASLRRVLNATGVLIHTNLGRAPLPPAAMERVVAIGSSYSNLEFDL